MEEPQPDKNTKIPPKERREPSRDSAKGIYTSIYLSVTPLEHGVLIIRCFDISKDEEKRQKETLIKKTHQRAAPDQFHKINVSAKSHRMRP